MIKISPSILSCDFGKISDEIAAIKKAGADMVHLDVMDGNFVNNISFGIPVISSIRKCTDMFFDTHLMINEPERYLDKFIDAGSDMVTFHLEACSDAMKAIHKIHSRGIKAGISIKPATPAEAVFDYLEDVDMILVMTVEPGFGGQALIPSTLEKVKMLRDEINRRGSDAQIQVDGGINEKTAKLAVLAGADILVAGSYVFNADDRYAAIESLRSK